LGEKFRQGAAEGDSYLKSSSEKVGDDKRSAFNLVDVRSGGQTTETSTATLQGEVLPHLRPKGNAAAEDKTKAFLSKGSLAAGGSVCREKNGVNSFVRGGRMTHEILTVQYDRDRGDT